MNRFLGTSSLFFMFLCCEPYVSHTGDVGFSDESLMFSWKET